MLHFINLLKDTGEKYLINGKSRVQKKHKQLENRNFLLYYKLCILNEHNEIYDEYTLPAINLRPAVKNGILHFKNKYI